MSALTNIMVNNMISVIIVSWNHKDLLIQCLDSVLKQTLRVGEIIVVDNASSDGAPELVTQTFPSVILIRNKENNYFGKAANQGIRISTGTYVLCLNNDVVLADTYIEEAVKGFAQDPLIGMVSGKILSRDGKYIDSAGQYLTRSRRVKEWGYNQFQISNLKFRLCHNYLFCHPERSEGSHHRREKRSFASLRMTIQHIATQSEFPIRYRSYAQPRYIFSVCGAVAFYRRTMLEAICEKGEFFDESFVMFYEDIDIALRAHKKGYRGYYVPTALAYHQRASSTIGTQKLDTKKRFLVPSLPVHLRVLAICNRYRLMKKHDTWWTILRDLPWILCWEICQWGYLLLWDWAVIRILFKK